MGRSTVLRPLIVRALIVTMTAGLLSVALVACGDDNDVDLAPDVPPAPADTPAPVDAPADPRSSTIANFALESFTVAAGTTVRWTNGDEAPHTATADDGSFDSGNLAQGESFEHTFDQPGTFEYFCAVHPTMRGTVTVE